MFRVPDEIRDEFEGTEEKRAGSVDRAIQIGFAVMFAMLGIVGIMRHFKSGCRKAA
jgi:hypothetical protein